MFVFASQRRPHMASRYQRQTCSYINVVNVASEHGENETLLWHGEKLKTLFRAPHVMKISLPRRRRPWHSGRRNLDRVGESLGLTEADKLIMIVSPAVALCR